MGDVDPIENIRRGNCQDRSCQAALIIVPGGLFPDLVRDGVGRSLRRVTASVSASGARSASLKYGWKWQFSINGLAAMASILPDTKS
jgi:hypothetical protein